MLEQQIEQEEVDSLVAFLAHLPLFKDVPPSTLKDLVHSMTLLFLSSGETLIQQGDHDPTLYILWHGRLRIFRDNNPVGIAEISVGEIVGEIALLTNRPRTATVRAIRRSIVLKLTSSHFADFEKKHPHEVIQIAKIAVTRLIAKPKPIQPGEKIFTLAIAPAGDSDHTPFLHRLVEELNKVKPTLLITAETLNRHFGIDLAHSKLDTRSSIMVDAWLGSLENQYQFLIFKTDHQWSQWTQTCFQKADNIFLVADEEAKPHLNSIEKALFSEENNLFMPSTYLTFIHKKETISNSKRWLDSRPVEGFYHVHLTQSESIERMIRFLTNQAFGVVLSGGGTRSFVDVGILRALRDLKIPVDCIGGCSMGALLGGGYALYGNERAFEVADQICHDKKTPQLFRDYTLPLISLLKGKRITKFLQNLYEGTYIEDLRIPFFCCSSNLTKGKLHIHQKGLLWFAVRASVSIPAVFPPVYDQEGNMLVDGGVINNLPVNVMRKFLRGGKVLAVSSLILKDLEPIKQVLESEDFKKPWLSGWRHFFRTKILGQKSDYDHLINILRSSFFLSADQTQKEMAQEADYHLAVDTSQYGFLQFKTMYQLEEVGYRAAMEQLPTIMKNEYFVQK